MIFNVDITERVAKLQPGEHERLICGNSGDQIKFTFDSEWDAYTTKTARFVWDKKHFDVEFTGDTCEIPVVTNDTVLLVGVYAGEAGADEDCIASTNARIPCVLSSRCGDHEANGGTGENYTNEARGYAATAKASAESAEASAQRVENKGKVYSHDVTIYSDSFTELISFRYYSTSPEPLHNLEYVRNVVGEYSDPGQKWIGIVSVAQNLTKVILVDSDYSSHVISLDFNVPHSDVVQEV